MTQYQLGAPRSNPKTFFGLYLHLAERCCENLQSARGLARFKFGPAMQGSREPNVGPGPAQILRIFGFVNSKTDGENATVQSKF